MYFYFSNQITILIYEIEYCAFQYQCTVILLNFNVPQRSAPYYKSMCSSTEIPTVKVRNIKYIEAWVRQEFDAVSGFKAGPLGMAFVCKV